MNVLQASQHTRKNTKNIYSNIRISKMNSHFKEKELENHLPNLNLTGLHAPWKPTRRKWMLNVVFQVLLE